MLGLYLEGRINPLFLNEELNGSVVEQLKNGCTILI